MSTVINFKNVLNQGVNYNRYYIQSLIKYNKPIIVTGKFVGQSNSAITKYTFTNIKPYVSEEKYNVYELTSHINIDKIYLDEIFNEVELRKHMNKIFVMVCKPYYYKDSNGLKRASLEPTDELIRFGFPSFKLLSESKSSNDIPWKEIIDFRTEFNYKFVCPKNSKYSRYNKDGIPIKDFVYIESYGESKEKVCSLDDMIKNSIGYSIFDDSEITGTKKQRNFHKKSNLKSMIKSSAKRKMYNMKHSCLDSSNNYNLFQL